MDAINFLLATVRYTESSSRSIAAELRTPQGLIRVLADSKGSISAYRAVGKKEVEACVSLIGSTSDASLISLNQKERPCARRIIGSEPHSSLRKRR